MNSARSLLTVLTIACLQFSICTGGLLSATLVVFANASTPTNTIAYMSSAQEEGFLCAFATQVVEQSTDHIKTTEVTQQPVASSCSQGEACVQNGTATREDSIVVAATIAALPPPAILIPTVANATVTQAKRTIAFSQHLKHTMVKQE